MSPAERMGKMKSGFMLVDVASNESLPNSQRRDSGGKTITRKEFDGLLPVERTAKIKEGTRVAD